MASETDLPAKFRQFEFGHFLKVPRLVSVFVADRSRVHPAFPAAWQREVVTKRLSNNPCNNFGVSYIFNQPSI